MRIARIIAGMLMGVLFIIGACAPKPALAPTPKSEGFITSNLIILHQGESEGQAALSVTVTNTGEQAGTYTVVLKIDGIIAETQNVTLAGGASQVVIFNPLLSSVGKHVATIDQLTGELEWMGGGVH